ncbi:MAG: 5-methylcytosine-specific restriction endonuclease system specificity protein McrC [Anaerolineae bacterium]
MKPTALLSDTLLVDRRIGRIPLRNLWFLMLYASDVARFTSRFDALVEEDLDNLPELVATLLAREVELRMRRNLTRNYRHREAVLTRVRGRIDLLRTSTERLLDRGEVACRFDELTLDTTRNRFVRAALERIARLVTDRDLAQHCRRLGGDFGRAGVSGVVPSRADLARDQISRNDDEDRFMLALARLSFDLALPTEEAGRIPLAAPDREERWIRRLFEKAVSGFYAVELSPMGWIVRSGYQLQWPITVASDGIDAILPSMRTDVILDAPDGRRIVIDTKFTAIVTAGWYREESLKSAYLYQIYAYLRSQEKPDDRASPWNTATGILVHPAINKGLDERMTIQGHQVRFVTVDLAASPQAIRRELREIVLAE